MSQLEPSLKYNFTPAFKQAFQRVSEVLAEAKQPNSKFGAEHVRAVFKKEMLALGMQERIQNLYRIYNKQTAEYVQLKLKPAQRRFVEECTKRDIILKPRQVGYSTLMGVIGYDHAIWEEGRVGIMAQDLATVRALFENVRIVDEFFQKEFGQYFPLESNKDNANELSWKNLKGHIWVRSKFQGYTLTLLHVSEAAFIEADKIINSMQAVSEVGWVVLESTPNGPGGYYYNIYQEWKRLRGASPFKGHFIPWFENYPEHPEEWQLKGDLRADAEEQDLINLYNLQPHHILYRRKKLSEMGGDREWFENQYPSDDVACFLAGENNVYPTAVLKTQSNYVGQPAFVGNFILDGKKVRFVNDSSKGLVRIWDLPKPGKLYYVGADPSGGTGGDPGAAIVQDGYTGEQVATLHGFMDPDLFADELFKLGQYYNQAWLNIESNNHGSAVILKLKGVYPNIYRRQHFDNITKRMSSALGFYTTNSDKVAITDNHVAACREGKFKVRDQRLLDEMGTFVQLSSEHGRTLRRQARAGCHDDLVMSACLCWEMYRSRPPSDFANESQQNAMLAGLTMDPDTGFFTPDDNFYSDQEDNWFN